MWVEQIDNPERIGELLSALARHGASAVIDQDGNEVPAELVAYDSDVCALRWIVRSAIVKPPFRVQLHGFCSLLTFDIKQGFQRAHHLITNIPKSVQKVRQRFHRRTKPNRDIKVSFRHPQSGEMVGGAVRNLSYGGLAVEANLPTDSR